MSNILLLHLQMKFSIIRIMIESRDFHTLKRVINVVEAPVFGVKKVTEVLSDAKHAWKLSGEAEREKRPVVEAEIKNGVGYGPLGWYIEKALSTGFRLVQFGMYYDENRVQRRNHTQHA